MPVKVGRFIARKNWIVVGSDDYQIRVFNYNTAEKVAQFEAHSDYIRTLAVHPTQPLIISGGDDSAIKMWDWEQGWRNVRTFEGHNHYVMGLAFNPKNPNSFASASLDGSIKIWSLSPNTTYISFVAHKAQGANFVEYYPYSDKPYLITSSDDKTIRVWDYQMKRNVATLEDHDPNVYFAVYHPEIPIIISGHDDTIKIWNSITFELEYTILNGGDRAWCIACRKGSNLVAVGVDSGIIVFQVGEDNPAISMDPNGKLIWAKNSEVFSSIIKVTEDVKDGDFLPLTQKDLGSVEVYPTQLVHSPNGRFVAVTGDGEYIIYTALAWRNKAFGSAINFVWAQDSNEFAVRDSGANVKMFKNFKERQSGHLNIPFSATNIFGGTLLGVKGDEFVAFHDWETGKLVRRVDFDAKQVYWSESGELATITTYDTFYVLRFDRDVFLTAVQKGEQNEEDGAEDSFEVIRDHSGSVRTGKWIGDCFIYTTPFTKKLRYLVGVGKAYTIHYLDNQVYLHLLGYIPRDNSILLADKDMNVRSYHLSRKVIEYQSVVLRGDVELAADLLKDIPPAERSKVCRFLGDQGLIDLASEADNSTEQSFDLELAEGDFYTAEMTAAGLQSEQKWKILGDKAIAGWNLTIARGSFYEINDAESLFLISTCSGDLYSVGHVAKLAAETGKYNLAFNALWYLRDIKGCVDLLNKTGRHSEAAMMSLTYGGDTEESVKQWKAQLTSKGKHKTARAILSPEESPEKFPASLVGNGSANLIDTSDIPETSENPELPSDPTSESIPEEDSELIEA